jgi:hypothetical protein
MGEGFIGDIRTERKIVLALFIIGLLMLIASATGAADGEEDRTTELEGVLDDGGLPALAFGLAVISWVAMLLIVQFSVLRTTGRNGEWIWFSFAVTGSALGYYLLDALNSDWVKGA